MEIIGLGTDIVEVARVKKAISSEKFLTMCFTKAEVEYCSKKEIQSFAGMFAAKESVAKAIGSGFSGFLPRDVEICHTDEGVPFVKLSNEIKLATNSSIMLSISHENAYATAVAMIVKEGEPHVPKAKPKKSGQNASEGE
ncbi:MAG: holo-ACP synthase [Defluviitaleaceae bacterium]|nr:holo-ACP synthase [Defluviitaleaceae bacterium]